MLENSGEMKIIRSDWVNKSQADLRNGGVLPSEAVKIFYSRNKVLTANFEIESQLVFDRNATACYSAFVLKMTGE